MNGKSKHQGKQGNNPASNSQAASLNRQNCSKFCFSPRTGRISLENCMPGGARLDQSSSAFSTDGATSAGPLPSFSTRISEN